jgi:TRAP transporter 4TM/12TM fusion protein
VSAYWYYLISELLWSGLYFFETSDIIVGSIGLAALLELSRRAIGLPLFLVCAIAIGYGVFGESLPNAIRHAGFDFGAVIETVWYSFDGVFGQPVAVVTSLILIFILFGAVLQAIGTGDALLRVARKATAGTRGGPAHGAVVASGIFGTISGSTVANVVGTGVFTMPMIKQHGFPARFAGAVEAAASTGGQIMPPIMGAVAFIMADVTGIPYIQIALAALVPSIFFYLAIFVYVTVKAGKLDLKASQDAMKLVLTRQDWMLMIGFVVPLAVIVGLLLMGRSPANGGFFAVITAFVIGLLVSRPFRTNPRLILSALISAGKGSATLLIAVAAVGVVIGVMNMTGLGLKFANAVLSVSGDNLFLALVLTMLACLVLGMGMPTVPAYLIIILVMGPALAKMGIPLIAAHLFAVYYGVLSVITPPVALAAFAAAPICGARPLAVAAESCKVGTVAFFLPFVFVYEPSLLLITDDFSLMGLLTGCLRLAGAIWMLSTGFEGWSGLRLNAAERALRIAAGLCLLLPNDILNIAGAAGALILLGLRERRLFTSPST